MTPDDLPHAMPHVYFVPQTCGHVLEFRCKNPCVPGDFAPLLGSACHWCTAVEMDMDVPPDEFRSQWRGGSLIRKCPFTVVELKELALIEAEVVRDAAPPPTK